MDGIFSKEFTVRTTEVDRFDRLKWTLLLEYLQEAAGDHCALLGTDRQALARKGLFWAVLRHKVQITRLPRAGENITVETWPMPTTRTAYPRAAWAYDREGKELFRSASIWVLMDPESRAMILPKNSGVEVPGLLRGDELALPGSMALRELPEQETRQVRFTELDWNGHMNNCRYMDWIQDTLPGAFYRDHFPRELSVCYLSEAREGERLNVAWGMEENSGFHVEITRSDGPHHRVFSANVIF